MTPGQKCDVFNIMNTFYPIIKVLTTSCYELYLKFCAWFSAIVTLTGFPPNMCRQTVAHFVRWWAEDPPKQRRWWLGPGCAPQLPSSLLPSTPGNRRVSKCWSQNGANTRTCSSQHRSLFHIGSDRILSLILDRPVWEKFTRLMESSKWPPENTLWTTPLTD